MNGFYNNNVYYTGTDTLCVGRKNWNVFYKTKLVQSGSCQDKKDYGEDKLIF